MNERGVRPYRSVASKPSNRLRAVLGRTGSRAGVRVRGPRTAGSRDSAAASLRVHGVWIGHAPGLSFDENVRKGFVFTVF